MSAEERMRHFLAIAASVFSEARWLSRDRLLLYGSSLAFVSLGMLALDLAQHIRPGLTDISGEHFGRDFRQFWSSAQLAAAGRPGAAYTALPNQTIDQVFPYPPIVM